MCYIKAIYSYLSTTNLWTETCPTKSLCEEKNYKVKLRVKLRTKARITLMCKELRGF